MRSLAPFALVAFSALAFGCAPDAVEPSDGTTARQTQPIINGTTSGTDQDFVVQIAVRVEDKTLPYCSGTMIAKNLVLTARHCVGVFDAESGTVTNFKASALQVFTGAAAPRRIDAGESADARGAKVFTADSDVLVPDVALLLLDRSLDTPVASIRLEGGATKTEVLDVVGFGIDETNAKPDVRMQRTGVTVLDLGPTKTARHQLFDGEFIFGEAACSGDSGGPALSATTHAVVGVASRVGNGSPRTPEDPSAFCIGAEAEDVYTALAPVKDVVTAAFAAAGAKPIIEGSSSSDSPPSADDAKPAAATAPEEAPPPSSNLASTPDTTTTTTTTKDGLGCAMTRAPAPSSRSSTTFAVAIAVALLSRSLRRCRSTPRPARARQH